jgi:hypothetical protein
VEQSNHNPQDTGAASSRNRLTRHCSRDMGTPAANRSILGHVMRRFARTETSPNCVMLVQASGGCGPAFAPSTVSGVQGDFSVDWNQDSRIVEPRLPYRPPCSPPVVCMAQLCRGCGEAATHLARRYWNVEGPSGGRSRPRVFPRQNVPTKVCSYQIKERSGPEGHRAPEQPSPRTAQNETTSEPRSRKYNFPATWWHRCASGV